MESFNAAVLGSTGYTGQELTIALKEHPNIRDVQTPGREDLLEFEGAEVVFSALPHGQSAPEVARFRDLGCTVIDLSGDLRFATPGLYEKWYGQPHPEPRLLSNRVPYGLPEMNREELEPGTKLVAMPGCYPTATVLALAPLVKRGLIKPGGIMAINADSGYSGRGKDADNSDVIHNGGTGHNVKPYKTGERHQHIGEMRRFLHQETIFFSPKVLPIKRGMLVQSTAQLAVGATANDVLETLEETYAAEPFVAVSPDDKIPDIAETAHTDECHIGFVAVRSIIQVGSSIDNLRKGAASQAVQAFNLIHGLPETMGLTPKAGWQPV